MGMALKKDVVEACRKAGTERPLDLAFLSRQTMGDSALEAELLNLFKKQASTLYEKASGSASPDEVRMIAHTLKGVSRSIGAGRLGELAAEWETTENIDTAALKSELDEICRYIDGLGSGR